MAVLYTTGMIHRTYIRGQQQRMSIPIAADDDPPHCHVLPDVIEQSGSTGKDSPKNNRSSTLLGFKSDSKPFWFVSAFQRSSHSCGVSWIVKSNFQTRRTNTWKVMIDITAFWRSYLLSWMADIVSLCVVSRAQVQGMIWPVSRAVRASILL